MCFFFGGVILAFTLMIMYIIHGCMIVVHLAEITSFLTLMLTHSSAKAGNRALGFLNVIFSTIYLALSGASTVLAKGSGLINTL